MPKFTALSDLFTSFGHQQLAVYNIYFSVTTSMRRRSGALHCESELDFLQLAEAAHDHMGVFYDERTNRKIMTHLRSPQPAPLEVHNPEQAERTKQEYRGFEFGLESEAEREEREQLSRANLETTCQLNVGIVGTHTERAGERLRGRQEEAPHEYCPFDLITQKRNKTIVKYWIFRRQHNLSQTVLDIYLKRCQLVLLEEGERWRVSRSEGDSGCLGEEIERRLN